ncbi:hypothetical protein N331_09476, partial [Merops nubicus]
FAFTIPMTNKAEPADRYEWIVLPQGMKNSPTLCQLYVAWALKEVRKKWKDTIIYHYMDDILFVWETPIMEADVKWLEMHLKLKGLTIAPEKMQQQAPWKYLGWILTDSEIHPQKPLLINRLDTITDLQKLLGDIQWIRSIVGISNEELQPLVQLLCGTRADDKISITTEQKQFLQKLVE